MDPPHIKSSCGTQNKNSNPMGEVGLILCCADQLAVYVVGASHTQFSAPNPNAHPSRPAPNLPLPYKDPPSCKEPPPPAPIIKLEAPQRR